MRKAKRARKAKKATKARMTKRSRSKTGEIEREAMEIPFVRTLSAKDPGLGRVLRHHYTLGARSVR